MGYYRKRPVVIEAYRFDLTAPDYGLSPEFLAAVCAPGKPCTDGGWFRVGWDFPGHIATLEGPVAISNGDWIVKGTQGEFYPVKPKVFDEVYEAAEDVS